MAFETIIIGYRILMISHSYVLILYLHKLGPIGGAPYIAPRLEGWADIRGINVTDRHKRAPR